jgi:hypothetical protein
MRSRGRGVWIAISFVLAAGAAAQERDALREGTRTKVQRFLEKAGKHADVNIVFREHPKEHFVFTGRKADGITVSDFLEVVITVAPDRVISLRVYPHYKGGYVNIDERADGPDLMRRMLVANDRTFLYWGADDAGDVFSGFTFTLESGFPEESLMAVLRSAGQTDRLLGELLAPAKPSD